MPHPALIALAVSAGVGGIVAFEIGVFKPWREEHWPDGFAQGVKQEWDVFAEDVREGFREISGDRIGHRNGNFGGGRRDQQQRRDGHRRRPSEWEEDELRREMDDFSLHEAETSGVKARLADEFQEEKDGARKRRPYGASPVDASEDALINAPRLSYATSSSYDRYKVDTSEVQSPHHKIGEMSPSSTSAAQLFEGEDQARSNHTPAHSFHAGSDGWQSPRSNNSTERWQVHFSPVSNPASPGGEGEEEDGSDSWTQLDDSRSSSPVSPTWSVTDVTGSSR
ncbi:hypothetical protein CBS101457_000983 [Exobasidium rhododendri]|nr:hypothetical protein CBS101457_000983 [Exobasidium rhododendri]